VERYTFKLTTDGRQIEPLQNELGHTLMAAGVRPANIHDVKLALGEWLENVIQHAFTGGTTGEIGVECELFERELVLRVRDAGKPFDPTQFPESEPGSAFSPRGLSLMRKLVDAISYQRLDHGNVLELRKQVRRDRND